MRIRVWTLLMASCALLAGCVTPPKKDLSAFTSAAPRSVLVVPVVNKTLDVDAQNYVLSTLPVPVAEKGYYVFPINTSKFVLEQEGYYEPERVHQMPPQELAKLFDADAVLYVTINRWDAQYIVLSTTVTVEFDYKIVGREGQTLWTDRQRLVYSPNNSQGGLIAALVNAAIARAAPNYMPLTRQANGQAFYGHGAIPDGPYKTPAKK